MIDRLQLGFRPCNVVDKVRAGAAAAGGFAEFLAAVVAVVERNVAGGDLLDVLEQARGGQATSDYRVSRRPQSWTRHWSQQLADEYGERVRLAKDLPIGSWIGTKPMSTWILWEVREKPLCDASE